MNPVIQIQDVKKTFKKVAAVKGVSLTVQKGEFVALLGPNGAGKTTLVEMIEGIQKPDSGTISLFGKTWQHDAKELHQRMGLCLQETQFPDRLSVLEVMDVFAKLYSQPQDRLDTLLGLVGLAEKKSAMVNALSGGQRQKLALAVSLLNQPELLLLDEPTTGLDPTARREIWGILDGLKKQGLTLILTTHYLEEADYLCERIVMLNQGQIMADGTASQLKAQFGLADGVSLDDLFLSLTGRPLNDAGESR
ncbi:MAG: ABC transporter ATP-binding protein [Candidatus Margulisiibacteriota bacterium]